MRPLHSLLLFSSLLSLSSTLKILVYNPKHAYSHVNYLGRVADLLQEDGHSVTSLMPEIVLGMKNGTAKSEIVSVPQAKGVFEAYKIITEGSMDYFSTNLENPYLVYKAGQIFAKVFGAQCAATLDSGVVEEMRERRFDVYIVETYDPCGMMLSHLLKPRSVILVSTTFLWQQQLDEVGIPRELSYNPSVNTARLDVHSFWSRLGNVFLDTLTQEVSAAPRRAVDKLFRERFGPDYPSIKELTSRVTFVFTNSNPLYDFAVPTLAKVVPVPGLGARLPKPLDEIFCALPSAEDNRSLCDLFGRQKSTDNQTWSSVLARRPKTVLISFGSITNMASMTPAYKQSFVKMFSALPNVTFILKYRNTEDDYAKELGKLGNVEVTAWMPQNDLLADPRLVLFITHCGMGSVEELMLRGKPGVFIPLFWDQRRNALMLEQAGVGVHLSKTDVGMPEKLIAAVREAMEEEKYARRANQIHRMLKGRPYSSKDLLLKHVQFAGEFGEAAISRPRSHDMNWVEYQNADVWLFIVSSLSLLALLSVYSLIGIIHCIYKKCCRSCCSPDSASIPQYSAHSSAWRY